MEGEDEGKSIKEVGFWGQTDKVTREAPSSGGSANEGQSSSQWQWRALPVLVLS